MFARWCVEMVEIAEARRTAVFCVMHFAIIGLCVVIWGGANEGDYVLLLLGTLIFSALSIYGFRRSRAAGWIFVGLGSLVFADKLATLLAKRFQWPNNATILVDASIMAVELAFLVGLLYFLRKRRSR